MRPGARWISSITAVCRSRMKATGSLSANLLNCSSSSVMKGRPSLFAIRRASVVLPDWRGQTIATMRISVSAAQIRCSACRAIKLPALIVGFGMDTRLIRILVSSNSECDYVRFGTCGRDNRLSCGRNNYSRAHSNVSLAPMEGRAAPAKTRLCGFRSYTPARHRGRDHECRSKRRIQMTAQAVFPSDFRGSIEGRPIGQALLS